VSLNQFFLYFGAKHGLAPRYPPPRHQTIVEPFAGSAGYSLRHHWLKVVLVEKDPAIAGIWRYLIGASAREILALPDLPRGATVDDLGVSDDARWLIRHWLNKGAGVSRRLSPRALDAPDQFWSRTIRARIASQLPRIRHWQIIEGDYSQAPDVDATWFVDPPYEVAGVRYRCSSNDIDFPALATWCRSRRGQVMVCEQEGASWLPFSAFRVAPAIRAHVGEELAISREAIWTNDRADVPPSAKPCDTPP
jgi:hypothetical protein